MISRDLRGRPPDVSTIVPGLLVGEYPRVADVAWLRERHAVSAVLSLQHESDLWDKGVEIEKLEAEYRRHSIEFRRVPVQDYDEAELESALETATAIVDDLLRAGHTVLVHCNAGLNRAPTIAVAYLCAHHGMTLETAARHVKARRACMPYLSVLRKRFGAR